MLADFYKYIRFERRVKGPRYAARDFEGVYLCCDEVSRWPTGNLDSFVTEPMVDVYLGRVMRKQKMWFEQLHLAFYVLDDSDQGIGVELAAEPLTELAIGMLVIGILASVAVPNFLGARNTAYDDEAQRSLSAVLNAATILYQNQGDFSDATTAQCGDSTALAADIQKLEPGIDVVAASVSSSNPLVVSVQAGQTWS